MCLLHAWHVLDMLVCFSLYLCQYLCIYLLLIQLAQPIRLLLKYTGTEFEDVQYDTGEGMYLS